MNTLMDSTDGRYQVATESSTYIIDLDRHVIRRLPRTRNENGSLLRRDDELITLLEVIECTIGREMVLIIDLHVAGVPFTTRVSTPVTAIKQIHSPGTKRADQSSNNSPSSST